MTTQTARSIALAFRDGRTRTIKSTQTSRDGWLQDRHGVWGGAPYVALHGHIVAYQDRDGVVMLSLAGYPTRTTRDRLNAILEAYGSPNRFWQHRWTQYYGAVGSPRVEWLPVENRDWVPLAGPLGMLALAASRRKVARTPEDQAVAACGVFQDAAE